MSEEVKTFVINDSRISNITDSVLVGVKKGPAGSICQKYKQVSNTNSQIQFAITPNSENTLLERSIKIKSTLRVTYKFGPANPGAAVPINVVPASFPINTALSQCSVKINDTSISTSSQEINEVLKKQYSQRFLSKHCQTTPNYVDKYFAMIKDAAKGEPGPGSYFSGIMSAEKDSDVVGRGNSNMRATLYKSNGDVIPLVAGIITLPAGADGANAYLVLELDVLEPLLNVPTLEMKSGEAAFIGVRSLNLYLTLNDCSHVFYIESDPDLVIASIVPGNNGAISTFFDDQSELVVNSLTLHASDYKTLSTTNVIPYNKFSEYITRYTKPAATMAAPKQSFEILSTQIPFTQVPDKIYICVNIPYSRRPITVSNGLNFPITNVSVDFNNRNNILSDLNATDLFNISRINGNTQLYQEFMGDVTDNKKKHFQSLGSIVVLDPVANLNLDDYLSSGSIGQFGFQVKVQCDAFSVGGAETSAASDISLLRAINDVQLTIIASFGGVLITKQGSSYTKTGLLGKVAVLETKISGASVGDSEHIEDLKGGNIGTGLASIGDILKKKGAKLLKSKIDDAVGGRYSLSGAGSGASRLSKYI